MMSRKIFWFLSIFVICSAVNVPCNLRRMSRGFVCVCNSTYCDSLQDYLPEAKTQFVVVSSTDGGLRFNVFRDKISRRGKSVKSSVLRIPYCLSPECVDPVDKSMDAIFDTPFGRVNVNIPDHEGVVVDVDPSKKFQKVFGFGGAYTGSVTYIVSSMPKGLRDNFYRSYYSKGGIDYRLMRWPIGGCDFDFEFWAYNEYPENDLRLTNFTELHPSEVERLSQISELRNVTNNDDVKIMASAWSTPKWMKTNQDYIGFGFLKLNLYQTWADYYIKYLELMEKHEIRIWALGTANEIFFSMFADIQSLRWTPYNYANWLSKNLSPTLRASKYNNTLIFILDEQRIIIPIFISEMERVEKGLINKIDGFAMHWYSDKRTIYNPQNDIRRKYQDKLMLMTESAICTLESRNHTDGAPRLGHWRRGTYYADLLIENFKNSIDGWIDWNLILNESGGPKVEKYYNPCDAAMIVNTTTYEEFFKQPIFFILGHFSKFLIRDTVRIHATASSSSVDAIAFLRPDRVVVVIIHNPFFVTNSINVMIRVTGLKINFSIPSYSIHTVLVPIDDSHQ